MSSPKVCFLRPLARFSYVQQAIPLDQHHIRQELLSRHKDVPFFPLTDIIQRGTTPPTPSRGASLIKRSCVEKERKRRPFSTDTWNGREAGCMFSGGGEVATSTVLMRTPRPTCFPTRSAVCASLPNLAWPSLTHYLCPSGLSADSEALLSEEKPPHSLPLDDMDAEGCAAERWPPDTPPPPQKVFGESVDSSRSKKRASVWHGFAPQCWLDIWVQVKHNNKCVVPQFGLLEQRSDWPFTVSEETKCSCDRFTQHYFSWSSPMLSGPPGF